MALSFVSLISLQIGFLINYSSIYLFFGFIYSLIYFFASVLSCVYVNLYYYLLLRTDFPSIIFTFIFVDVFILNNFKYFQYLINLLIYELIRSFHGIYYITSEIFQILIFQLFLNYNCYKIIIFHEIKRNMY